jgi:hypothetical protein
MDDRCVSIAIRSCLGRPPRVRFERRAELPQGILWLRMTQDEIVVVCSATAVDRVDSKRGAGGFTLYDGPLEVAIGGPEGDDDVARGPSARPSHGGVALLPAGMTKGAGVPDAEWSTLEEPEAQPRSRVRSPEAVCVARPVPASPRASTSGSDAPTRILPIEDVLVDAGLSSPRSVLDAARERADATPAGPHARRLMSSRVRRFALVGLVASSLMICLRARRAHEVRAVRSASAADAASAPATAPASAAAAVAPVEQRERPAPEGSLAPRKGEPTKARRAADALAGGDYPAALDLYRDLQHADPNPAYARIVDGLQSSRTAPFEAPR